MAIILFAGLVMTGAPVARAASDMAVSDDFVEFLKKEEGFAAKPYWDYSQWTVGYGTKCPSDMLEEYKEKGISKEDLALFSGREKIRKKERKYLKNIGG